MTLNEFYTTVGGPILLIVFFFCKNITISLVNSMFFCILPVYSL